MSIICFIYLFVCMDTLKCECGRGGTRRRNIDERIHAQAHVRKSTYICLEKHIILREGEREESNYCRVHNFMMYNFFALRCFLKHGNNLFKDLTSKVISYTINIHVQGVVFNFYSYSFSSISQQRILTTRKLCFNYDYLTLLMTVNKPSLKLSLQKIFNFHYDS